MKKWIVVAVVLLLVAIWWSRRRTEEGYTSADILTPGGINFKPYAFIGLAFLASPSVVTVNAIVSALPASLQCAQYTTVPSITGAESTMTYTTRVVARAVGYAPLKFADICSTLGITQYGTATPVQAAQAFTDMYNAVNGQQVSLTNLNATSGTTFTSLQDFTNQMSTVNSNIINLCANILAGFTTWNSSITFDPTFNPTTFTIPINGYCVIGGKTCSTGLTCNNNSCQTATCANGGVSCGTNQSCVSGTCTNNCGTNGGTYCATSGQVCNGSACVNPCGTNGGTYCATSGQVCNGSTCVNPCGTNGGTYCSDSTKTCINGKCQTPTCANGGVTCGQNQYCDSNGQCQTNAVAGSGTVAQALLSAFK